MAQQTQKRAHLIAGGFPPGSFAGHDIDYTRLRLLEMLKDSGGFATTVSNDFTDIEKWLPGCEMLVTYVAGPFPDTDGCGVINKWLENGGRWLALHGTSGGKAARIPDSPYRRMVNLDHHDSLGCFFLNHPPVRKFSVEVADHPLTEGLPSSFEVMDELYLLEMLDPNSEILLTTELEIDPSLKRFGFVYDEDTALQPDGKTRVLGYVRTVGKGHVIYYGLGHCHTPSTNVQPFVDESVAADGKTPLEFKGPWETDAFQKLLTNAIDWCATNSK
jgi:hypothetical protein